MFGAKVLEETFSPYNGKILVIKNLEGTRIVVDGIAQSGKLVTTVWKKALGKIKNLKPEVKEILVLGLGGGSVMEITDNYWPYSKKIGVEIDQTMVNIGKKYLNLNNIKNLNTVIENAFEWVNNNKGKSKFDIILVDLCIGGNIPKEFITKDFMRDIKTLLKIGGIAAFNHLYFGQKKEEAHKFEKNLDQVFSSKLVIKPNSNIIFITNIH